MYITYCSTPAIAAPEPRSRWLPQHIPAICARQATGPLMYVKLHAWCDMTAVKG